ncbi:MAG: class I SAM-dependent methyltransferase [Dehalococcoidales bacterium]|nr:MAG: class I SAM-dependent methyltransferase [Dehalococcoidales bacterium]
MHEANRKWWDVSSPDWKKLDEETWKTCKEQSSFALDNKMQKVFNEFIGSAEGKNACVISSGDNFAAFALASKGMKITSTDISEIRLNIARERAAELGLDIDFFQCDSSDLSPLQDDSYDLVISTPGTYVWISDLKKVYSEVYRVLKPGGFFIFHEIHPFTRPWKDQPEFEIAQPYFETGPYIDERPEGKTYEYLWMMSDFINALANSGLIIRRVSEDPAEEPAYWEGRYYGKGGDESLLDWHVNPRAALPQWMVIAAQKPVV